MCKIKNFLSAKMGLKFYNSLKSTSLCFCFDVKKTLESRLNSKELKPVNPKRNQPWIFIERTDAEAETPILWPSDAKSRLIGKGPDSGKDWRQEEKGTTEEEMVVWHHCLNGHEFEQALRVGGGQRSLAYVLQSMGSQRVGHDWATELN